MLYFDGEGEDALRTQFPYLAWLREPGGDRFYLLAGELARIVLPFVRLVPPDVNSPRLSAADVAFVAAQPRPEAWTRWLRAIVDAQIIPQPESISLWLREAAIRLHSASPDIQARLQLFREDLVDSQGASQGQVDALSPADRTAYNAGLLFIWGALADKSDGMLRHAADLVYYSGALMCAKWRLLGSSWHSLLVTLYNIGIADGAIHASNQLDQMQVSAWFMRILKITVLPPELQVHYFLGFERTLDLQDRLAGRPQAKHGGTHSAAGMILQRFDYVIKHFPLTALLVATGPQHAPLHDQSLSDFIVEAARSLAPAGRQIVHSTLSLQLLRRLEGDISSIFATLLAVADFLKMPPTSASSIWRAGRISPQRPLLLVLSGLRVSSRIAVPRLTTAALRACPSTGASRSSKRWRHPSTGRSNVTAAAAAVALAEVPGAESRANSAQETGEAPPVVASEVLSAPSDPPDAVFVSCESDSEVPDDDNFVFVPCEFDSDDS